VILAEFFCYQQAICQRKAILAFEYQVFHIRNFFPVYSGSSVSEPSMTLAAILAP
jgi:hypothetical protein